MIDYTKFEEVNEGQNPIDYSQFEAVEGSTRPGRNPLLEAAKGVTEGYLGTLGSLTGRQTSNKTIIPEAFSSFIPESLRGLFFSPAGFAHQLASKIHPGSELFLETPPSEGELGEALGFEPASGVLGQSFRSGGRGVGRVAAGGVVNPLALLTAGVGGLAGGATEAATGSPGLGTAVEAATGTAGLAGLAKVPKIRPEYRSAFKAGKQLGFNDKQLTALQTPKELASKLAGRKGAKVRLNEFVTNLGNKFTEGYGNIKDSLSKYGKIQGDSRKRLLNDLDKELSKTREVISQDPTGKLYLEFLDDAKKNLILQGKTYSGLVEWQRNINRFSQDYNVPEANKLKNLVVDSVKTVDPKQAERLKGLNKLYESYPSLKAAARPKYASPEATASKALGGLYLIKSGNIKTGLAYLFGPTLSGGLYDFYLTNRTVQTLIPKLKQAISKQNTNTIRQISAKIDEEAQKSLPPDEYRSLEEAINQ